MSNQLFPVYYNGAENTLVFEAQARPYYRNVTDGTEATSTRAASVTITGIGTIGGGGGGGGTAAADIAKLKSDLAAAVARIAALEAAAPAAPAPAPPVPAPPVPAPDSGSGSKR